MYDININDIKIFNKFYEFSVRITFLYTETDKFRALNNVVFCFYIINIYMLKHMKHLVEILTFSSYWLKSEVTKKLHSIVMLDTNILLIPRILCIETKCVEHFLP